MENFVLALAMTTHIGIGDGYNNIHPHLRFHEDGAIAGVYYNSVNRVSVYSGYRVEPIENVGLEFAVVTGYPAFGPVAPYIRGTYDFNNNMRIFAAPAWEKEKHKKELGVGVVIGVELLLK